MRWLSHRRDPNQVKLQVPNLMVNCHINNRYKICAARIRRTVCWTMEDGKWHAIRAAPRSRCFLNCAACELRCFLSIFDNYYIFQSERCLTRFIKLVHCCRFRDFAAVINAVR